MPNLKEMSGLFFGDLLVLGYDEKRNGKHYWSCKCSCGKVKSVQGECLRRGDTTSCGCRKNSKISEKNKTHGLRDHPLYNTWSHIKDRCYRSTCDAYHNYGGRGISVCAEWLTSFPAFLGWSISNGWSQGLTIDRINVNGNYEPGNCRWVEKRKQCFNKRNNYTIIYNGVPFDVVKAFPDDPKRRARIRQRITYYGWSPEKAIDTP